MPVLPAFSAGRPRFRRGWRADSDFVSKPVQGILAAPAAAIFYANSVGDGLGAVLGDADSGQGGCDAVAEAWPSAWIRWMVDVYKNKIPRNTDNAGLDLFKRVSPLKSSLFQVVNVAFDHGSGFAFIENLLVNM
jgi:hypothetical protein